MKTLKKKHTNIKSRCQDADKLFPPSKPILCEEKSVNPYFEIKCCRDDNYCNKNIQFPRGEICISQTHIQNPPPPPPPPQIPTIKQINSKISIFHGQNRIQINSKTTKPNKTAIHLSNIHRSHYICFFFFWKCVRTIFVHLIFFACSAECASCQDHRSRMIN